MGCLDANTAAAFVQGALDRDTACSVEQHIDSCSGCRALLTEMARIASGGLADSGDSCPASPPPRLARGAAIGRYVALGVVGLGAMGIVYAAYDPDLDRKVALKLLRRSSHSTGRTRLQREARAMAQLSHPNVVAVYDVGMYANQVFLAMEFIEGLTLVDWLRENRRSWRQVMDVFTQAGRGLAAAHAAGIIHRDFKPENVLIGRDGRVVVTDFGLARITDGLLPEDTRTDNAPESASSASPASTLTATGTLLGTPAYMALEQYQSGTCDARSDQFSFCVALYEALYGERPYTGDSLAVLMEGVASGRIREAPSDAKVPSWLRRTILRGLSPDPTRRHPSMGALLAALNADPSKVWRRGVIAAALVGVCALGAAQFVRVSQHNNLVCKGAERKLVGVWDDAERKLVHDAFLATGKPYAQDAWKAVHQGLDAYAREWVEIHTEACEATHRRGEQSTDLLDLRMACLGERMKEFKALTKLMEHSDPVVVKNAVVAVGSLTPLDRCTDMRALTSVLQPPKDAAAAASVEEVRLKLAEIKALRDAGKYVEGLKQAELAEHVASALNHNPTEAQSLYLLGQLAAEVNDANRGERTLLQAMRIADAGRDDMTRAAACVKLLWVVGYQLAKQADMEEVDHTCVAILSRVGGSDGLDGERMNALGAAHTVLGTPEQARIAFEQAVQIRERAYGPQSREVSKSLSNLSVTLIKLGDLEMALAHARRALAITESAFGENHPEYAAALSVVGAALAAQDHHEEALDCFRQAFTIAEQSLGPDSADAAMYAEDIGSQFNQQGKYEQAEAMIRRALATQERVHAPDHPSLAASLLNLGVALNGQHKYDQAVEVLERSLRIRRGFGGTVGRAKTQIVLARALWDMHGDRGRARRLALEARDTLLKTAPSYASDLQLIEDWLKSHPSQ